MKRIFSEKKKILDLSIILPSLNELENLKLLIPIIVKLCKKYKYEILIIDDDSPDGTFDYLKKKYNSNKNIRVFKRKNNHGLAYSILKGIKLSKKSNLLVMDCDFNHRPQDIKKLLRVFKKKRSQIISGSRFVSGGGSENKFRHFVSLIVNKLINFILNIKLNDHLSGFFLLSKNYLGELDLNKIFYGYGDYYIRLLFYLKKKGYSITEVPVMYGVRKNGYSKSKFIKMFINYLWSTLKLKYE